MIYKIFNISAKVLSVLFIGIILLFISGGEPLNTKITYREIIMFIFFPFGMSAAMIYAWFRPRAGGILSVFCLTLFYLFEYIFKREFPQGPYFALYALPAFLFFLGSFGDKSLRKN